MKNQQKPRPQRKFSRVKKFYPKLLKTAHPHSTILFALSVRCNHTLAHV